MLEKTMSYLMERIPFHPQVGLVLGSGLGELAERLEGPVMIDYRDIPGFVPSTAPGHKGRLVFGRLAGRQVVCMQGRLHLYEGHALKDIVYPIRVLQALGIQTLLLTNAAGGIRIGFHPGDLMLIADHINFTGQNPLIGPNDQTIGPRFPDMTYTYTPRLRLLAKEVAQELGISLEEGVYLGLTGPSFETPAEIRMFRGWGADAVGMSTVSEVIEAAYLGLPVLAISLITNYAAGMIDEPLSGQEIDAIAQKRSQDLGRLLCAIISHLDLK